MSTDVTVRGTVIPPEELSWRFSRSPGPGGQSVNTTESRVELSYDLAGPPMHFRLPLRSGPCGRCRAGCRAAWSP